MSNHELSILFFLELAFILIVIRLVVAVALTPKKGPRHTTRFRRLMSYLYRQFNLVTPAIYAAQKFTRKKHYPRVFLIRV
jgi:hypothetical protein